jgi:DNA-binding MarR family transcriptional regulator
MGHQTAKITDAVTPEISRIGEVMARMRVMIGRRMIGRLAIAKIAPALELSHIDVLDIMRQIDSGGDVTVGTIAEALRIDPSRGSRVVADMVSQGLLTRDASQEDGRRSVLKRTPLGDTLLAEVRNVKFAVIRDVLDGWPDDEIETFSLLFERFVDRFEKRLLPDAQTPA